MESSPNNAIYRISTGFPPHSDRQHPVNYLTELMTGNVLGRIITLDGLLMDKISVCLSAYYDDSNLLNNALCIAVLLLSVQSQVKSICNINVLVSVKCINMLFQFLFVIGVVITRFQWLFTNCTFASHPVNVLASFKMFHKTWEVFNFTSQMYGALKRLRHAYRWRSRVHFCYNFANIATLLNDVDLVNLIERHV